MPTLVLALVWSATSVLAQTTAKSAVFVPFVGCDGDGQGGPAAAEEGSPVAVPLSSGEADLLAYYAFGRLGVLAPRGWDCFGLYGSSGSSLYVTPEPTDLGGRKLSGPVVEISEVEGSTSGRMIVANLVARVFPAFRKFALFVADDMDKPLSSIPTGPFPKDELKYQGERLVEYKTPSLTEGLGTMGRIAKGELPIEGAATLVGPTPSAVVVSIRLPANLQHLTKVIVRDVEREAAENDRTRNQRER